MARVTVLGWWQWMDEGERQREERRERRQVWALAAVTAVWIALCAVGFSGLILMAWRLVG